MAYYDSAAFTPKVNGTLTLSENDIVLTPSELTATVTATASGAISAVSSDTSICTVSVSGSTITINSVNQTEGTAVVTVTSEESPYCKEVSKEIDVEFMIPIFGVEWDGTATTKWTRTDAAADFTDPVPQYILSQGAENVYSEASSPFDRFMPWAGIEPYDDEWETLGSLVKIPKYYYKWTFNGSSIKLQISPSQLPGYSISPAHMDRGDGQGERDYVYVGRYHCEKDNYTAKASSYPAKSINIATARTNIHALGSDVWQYDFAMYWTIMMLYLVEYADWDAQKVIGLGENESNFTDPYPTGFSRWLPYHTGIASTSRSAKGVTKYRHIEGLWDNVRNFLDGAYLVNNNSTMKVYAIKNPSNFGDSGGTEVIDLTGTYSATGGTIKGYKHSDVSGFEYVLWPNAVDSSSSGGSYSTDTYVTDATLSFAQNGFWVAGGHFSGTAEFGPFSQAMFSSAANNRSVGCRLMKLPNNS